MITANLLITSLKCAYRNESDRIQVVRVEDPHHWVERTLAVGQLFQFESRQGAYLAIYSYEIASMLLCDRISCERLAVQEKSQKPYRQSF
jgi:hypothetical protein